MKKTEFVEALSEKMGITRVMAASMVDAYHEIISDTLAKEEDVTFVGFGTFSVRHRSARVGRHPRTGEDMQLKASRTPSFKAGKGFKDAVAL